MGVGIQSRSVYNISFQRIALQSSSEDKTGIDAFYQTIILKTTLLNICIGLSINIFQVFGLLQCSDFLNPTFTKFACYRFPDCFHVNLS